MKNYRFFLAVYVLTLLNLIFASRVLGQEFRMVNYSVSEGLPSSEVYCILQDRQGYMWFGTDRGAVRYDGYRFQVFTTADGMPDNTVFEIQEDTQGRIWFATYSPRLCHYENGKISPYKFNSEIDKKNYPNTPKLDFYIDGKNQVF
ncbi:MAG TPA: hypothetical protein ENJ82_13455, partial [Bacteroidetes bacterium]|nr:hypothetical protein [Bacteroidota bacterium]